MKQSEKSLRQIASLINSEITFDLYSQVKEYILQLNKQNEAQKTDNIAV